MDTENTAQEKATEATSEAPQAEVANEEKAPEATETTPEAPEEPKEEPTQETVEEPAKAEPEQPESEPQTEPVDTGEVEQLKATITQLTAELDAYKAKDEARKTGFKDEFVDDAVIIADFHAKKDGISITEALQAVANKHSDWRISVEDNNKEKPGFKVGAESPKNLTEAEDSSLDEAFGLHRKK